ncbi:MAG TPA: hypothetical protein VFJ24_11880 [Gaiellales bacterium]|nr:hypothetical protein [Gaiellales bacterium]
MEQFGQITGMLGGSAEKADAMEAMKAALRDKGAPTVHFLPRNESISAHTKSPCGQSFARVISYIEGGAAWELSGLIGATHIDAVTCCACLRVLAKRGTP